jgi:hypothetical protein
MSLGGSCMVKDAGAETLVTCTLAVLNISVHMSQAFQMFNVPSTGRCLVARAQITPDPRINTIAFV